MLTPILIESSNGVAEEEYEDCPCDNEHPDCREHQPQTADETAPTAVVVDPGPIFRRPTSILLFYFGFGDFGAWSHHFESYLRTVLADCNRSMLHT
jgi:hypothetical protein